MRRCLPCPSRVCLGGHRVAPSHAHSLVPFSTSVHDACGGRGRCTTAVYRRHWPEALGLLLVGAVAGSALATGRGNPGAWVPSMRRASPRSAARRPPTTNCPHPIGPREFYSGWSCAHGEKSWRRRAIIAHRGKNYSQGTIAGTGRLSQAVSCFLSRPARRAWRRVLRVLSRPREAVIVGFLHQCCLLSLHDHRH